MGLTRLGDVFEVNLQYIKIIYVYQIIVGNFLIYVFIIINLIINFKAQRGRQHFQRKSSFFFFF